MREKFETIFTTIAPALRRNQGARFGMAAAKIHLAGIAAYRQGALSAVFHGGGKLEWG
jgi:hypothetical protein